MAYKEKAKKTAYQNEFIKQAYDRINLTVPKGRKAEIQAEAERRGMSVNGFINKSIDEALERGAAADGQEAGDVPAVSAPEEKGTGAGGFGFSAADSSSDISSGLSSLAPPGFETALSDSGQSPEEYVAQAVRERVEREKARQVLDGYERREKGRT